MPLLDNPIHFLAPPSRFQANPAGHGYGVFIPQDIFKRPKMLKIAFQWLSRSGAVLPYTGQDLGSYQAAHLAALFALVGEGVKSVRRMNPEASAPTNYTLHKGRFMVWCKECRKWADTLLTPDLLRQIAQVKMADPIYQRVREERLGEEMARGMSRRRAVRHRASATSRRERAPFVPHGVSPMSAAAAESSDTFMAY